MHEFAILRELLIVLGVSLPVTYLLQRLRVPTVVGFLLAGVLIGPSGLGLIRDPESVREMAEIGVVLLLFVIGLKFSLRELLRMKALVLGAGGLQVALTIAASAGIGWYGGYSPSQAVFLGFLVALSSTAILLKLLEDRGELGSPQGRLSVGISLFQDLAVIPMILVVPLLASAGTASWGEAALALAKSLGVLGGFLVVAQFLYPWFLERVVRARNREIFMLAVVLVALGTAYLASLAGISLALGAFLAGMVISESEYSYQIVSEITPFRDIFNSIFFVSIGMLVDLSHWWSEPAAAFGLAAGIVGLKALVVVLVALAFGFGLRISLLAALALGQIGEFSFILAQAGVEHRLIEGAFFRQFLSASALTMALSPFAVLLSHAFTGRVFGPQPAGEGAEAGAQRGPAPARSHVIIVGYGINGRNVANLLREMDVPTIILELNPFTIRRLREAGEWAIFGDAVRRPVLLQAGVKQARALVVSIPDPGSCRQIVAQAKELNPSLPILVRTRYVGEVSELHRLGAEEVVAEEFEASLALAGRLMALYGMAEEEIEKKKESIRQEDYRLLREERKGI